MFNRLTRSPVLMSWASLLVQMGSGFLILPLLVKTLTPQELGLWFLFAIVLGFSLLADSGFGPSVVRAVAYFYAGRKELPTQSLPLPADGYSYEQNPNWQGIGRLLATLDRVYLLILISTALLLAIPGYWMVRSLVHLSEHPEVSWMAYLAACVSALASVAAIRWSSVAQGIGQMARVRAIDLAVGMFRVGAYVFLLLQGQGLLSMMLCAATCSVATWFWLRLSTKAWLTDQMPLGSDLDEYSYDKLIFSALWPATWRMGAILVGSYGISNAVSLLVSQGSDPILIASFLFTSRIILMVRQVAQVPLYASLPNIIRLVAHKDIKGVKRVLAKALAFEIYGMLFACLLLVLWGNELLKLLGLQPVLLAPALMVPLSIWAVAEAHHSAHAQVYMTSNHIPFLVPALVSGAAIVGLGYVLEPIYGVLGLVLVQLGVQAVWNNWHPVLLSLRWLDWRFTEYVMDILLLRFGREH